MKLGPITIGGRRDCKGGAGYQHCTASITVNPEDGDTIQDCMAKAQLTLIDAFWAAETAVEFNRPLGSSPAPATTPSTPPAPKADPKTAPAAPLKAFPTTPVGQLAQEIVTKATPTGEAPPAASKAAPAANPAPAQSGPEGLKRRVDAWRKSLAEHELSEGDFLKACGVSKPEDLKQLQDGSLTKNKLKAFVEDVAGILANADDMKV